MGRLSDVEDLSVQLERARFEAHIAGCTGCDRYLAQMRTTIALAGATPGLEQRPDVTGLLAAFRGWKR